MPKTVWLMSAVRRSIVWESNEAKKSGARVGKGRTVRDKLLIIGLIGVALGACGCIVIHTEEVTRRPEAAGPRSATIQEIDAVAKLSFDQDRQERYRQIAGREGLSERAQVHLVEAVFKHLSFEQAKVDVLLTLVHSPSLTPAAREVLLERLDDLSFEQDKRKILDALDR